MAVTVSVTTGVLPLGTVTVAEVPPTLVAPGMDAASAVATCTAVAAGWKNLGAAVSLLVPLSVTALTISGVPFAAGATKVP